jgi:hypothetical protein
MKGDELDQILDLALASYSAQEPRAGLSGHVLARLRLEPHVERRRWYGWLFACAAVACLTIGVVSWQEQSSPLTLALSPPPAPPVPIMQIPVISREAPMPMRVDRVPVREKFPSPVAPSREDRMLVALAHMAPEEARWLLRPEQPLEMKPIEIKPLQMDVIETGESK